MRGLQKNMKYIATKGIVQCEHCGFITYYGYLYKDKICHKCNAGFFRFRVNEVWTLDFGKNYDKYIHEANSIEELLASIQEEIMKNIKVKYWDVFKPGMFPWVIYREDACDYLYSKKKKKVITIFSIFF